MRKNFVGRQRFVDGRFLAIAFMFFSSSTIGHSADRILSREMIEGVELNSVCFGGIRVPGSFGDRIKQLDDLSAARVRNFSPFPSEIEGVIHFQMISAGRNSEGRLEVAIVFRSMRPQQCAHFITFPEGVGDSIRFLGVDPPAFWMGNPKDERSVYFHSMLRRCNTKSRSSDFSIAFCALIYEPTPTSRSFVPNTGSVEVGLKSRVSEFLIKVGSEEFSVTTIADRLFFSRSKK